MCGDEVEVGLLIGENGNADIRFSGRGCSICIASASILVEAVSGEKLDQLREQHQRISVWLVGDSDNAPEQMSVRALDSVRQLPARKRCMLLAWEALGESISKMEIR